MAEPRLTRKIDILELAKADPYMPDLAKKWDEEAPLFRNIWAEVVFTAGREFWKAQGRELSSGIGNVAETNISIIIRTRPALTPSMAVRYKGSIYEIADIAPMDGNSPWFSVLKCKNVSPSGL